MREKPRDIHRLQHIEDACNTLLSRSPDEWENAIDTDPVIYFGVVKLIEIIGEATYKLTKEFRDSHTSTPWDIIEDMRHVLVHGYYTISKDQLIETIRHDIAPLENQISQYILEIDTFSQS